MKKFEFIDITTADVAFLAYGKDLNELFANAALAMFEVMINTKQVEPKIKREIICEGDNLNSLMFKWLNEILVFVDSENVAFSAFDVKIENKKNGKILRAMCKGERINEKKHELRTEVKAATYHKMEIKKNNVWEACVILDI